MSTQPDATTSSKHSWLALVVILATVVGGSEAWSWWRDHRAAEMVRVHSQTGAVVMFTTDTCPFCDKARRWLNSQGARWQECNIDQSAHCAQVFQARGAPGVPLMNVNGQWRLGFDPVWVGEALQSSPKADKSPRP